MSDTPVPAVGRFSPTPGLFVDITEKTVAVSGRMELFGPEASSSRAQSIAHTINTTWTASFPDGHSVTCNVKVTYRAPGTAAGEAAQIEAIKIRGPSHVTMSDRSMTLNANESEAFTWTAAHEFGHVIGLQDRYSEGIMSRVSGTFGGTRTTTVNPKYQSNLMAVHGGVLESQNLRDLAQENAPSPYWVNDDGYVREWINHHPIAELRVLSTTNKINMIETLMGGWISEDDLLAIIRVTSAVTTRVEAEAIRAGIDLLDFSSIGQRTRVRIAFSSMP